MHFIGMLAFDVCAHGRIDPLTTMVSMLPAVVASWIALGLLMRPHVSAYALVIGGVLVGAGIGAMHYLGMAASQWATVMRYDPVWFGASVLVAVLLAIFALWCRFGLEKVVQWPSRTLNGVAGLVMGLAISGMHYTGMAAVRFTFTPSLTQKPDTVPLALGIAGMVAAIGMLVAAFNAGLLYWKLFLQLRESESRMRAIADTAADGMIVFDAAGTVQSFSAAAERILGWATGEVLGRNVSLFLNEFDLAALRSLLADASSKPSGEHSSERIEVYAKHRDGTLVPIGVSVGRVRVDGPPTYVGFFSDLTLRNEMQRERESTARAVDRALAVVEFDLNGTVLAANDNFLSLVDYRRDEVIGRHHSIFCDPSYVRTPAYGDFWDQLRKGVLDGGEYLRINRSGHPVWLQATYMPAFDASGRPFKVVKFATDLTARREMEQELRTAKDRAEEAAAARSTFLANMSHEIRTPMNAIIGFTEVLLSSELGDSQRRQLSTVHHSARSMLRLLNDILDTAKLEKGAVELEIADFSVRDVCEQILASLGIQSNRKGLTLDCEISSDVPEALKGDALRLQQVLLNLLGNAIKFTERGFVRLRVDYQRGRLSFEVEDSGIGIPAGQLQRIFDPFAQADASTTRTYGGTGLGTTIARQLVELMGGTIDVRSTVGVGTVFSVCVPLEPGVIGPTYESTSSAIALPSLRVLAVDDVPNNLELLQHHLGRHGHRVTIANDGQQAVQLYRAQDFDLVLMDLQMPGIDGLEATRQIRAHERREGLRYTPIIALSASVLEQDRHNARSVGMDGFANKPLEPIRLFAEMARVLPHSSSLASPLTEAAALPTPPLSNSVPSFGVDVVDWKAGLDRWGQPDRLLQAIARFVSEYRDRTIERNQFGSHDDLETIAAFAHRMRGAAGNLALVGLQRLGERLEAAARVGDRGDIDVILNDWPSLFSRVEAFVMERASMQNDSLTSATRTSQDPSRTTDTYDSQLVSGLIDSLLISIGTSEIDQTRLDALAANLPAGETTSLLDALDQFNFSAATTVLQELQAKWCVVERERAA